MKRLSFGAAAMALACQLATAGAPARLGENAPLSAPFCETFDNFRKGMEHDDFDRYFQVIDANNDKRIWAIYNYADFKPYGRCALMHFPEPEQRPDIKSADDWLLTRAVRLEAGKYYLVSVDATLYRDDTEQQGQRFEVRVGSHNDAEGMAAGAVVIPAVTVHTTTFSHHQGWFKPRATGLYYVGVHGISPAYYNYYNYLFIDNIAIDEPRTGAEPAKVVINSVKNSLDGSPTVIFDLTAPAKNIAGNAMEGVMTVVVKRDGSTIATRSDITPGQTFAITDTKVPDGEHLWTIEVSNSAGAGEPITLRHTSGIGAPMPPTNLKLTETSSSTAAITWDAPATDVRGNEIDPGMVSYQVFDTSTGTPVTIANVPAGVTSYDYAPFIEEGKQSLAQVCVRSYFNGRQSDPAVAPPLPLGTPYELPFANSFTMDDYYDFISMVNTTYENVTWRMLDDNSDPHAQDGDNGYIAMIGTAPGEQAELLTGKIKFNADDITLNFYTYVYPDDGNTIEVSVTDLATGQRTRVKTFRLIDYDMPGWTLLRADLSDFSGKIVQVGLNGTIVTNSVIPVDNMTITSRPGIDLEVSDVVYPSSAEPGATFDVTAKVTNYGTKPSGEFNVLLQCEGQTVATAKAASIAADESTEVKLTHSFTSVSLPMARFTVVAEHADEGFPANNVSSPFQIALEAPRLPLPQALTAAKAQDGSCTLTWQTPDLTLVAPEAITEGFEDCEPFEDLGDWTTFDADFGFVGGFNGVEMPVDHTQQGFWVMNSDDYEFIPAHSGSQLAVQMYGFDDPERFITSVECDDWLISPELYGGPQTVNFWARSYTRDYGFEQFEVLTSQGGTTITDFTRVLDTTLAPDSWTKFNVTLPDGARRFAIRCTSPDRLMLMIDDITFTPVASGNVNPLELKGYKIYRNEECLSGAEPISGTSFVVPGATDGERLNVTAVYANGESFPATVVVGMSGITEIEADPEAPAFWYNLYGQRIDAPTAPGIYIHGNKKVVIK